MSGSWKLFKDCEVGDALHHVPSGLRGIKAGPCQWLVVNGDEGPKVRLEEVSGNMPGFVPVGRVAISLHGGSPVYVY